MGETAPDITVELVWADTPELVVEQRDGQVLALAHVGLSEAQVTRACAELGDLGPQVLAAWRTAVRA